MAAPIGFGQLQLTRALDVQHHGRHGVGQIGNFTTAQRGPGFGQGVDLLAREPGIARIQAGRRLVQRHRKAPARLPPRLQHGLVISRQQTLTLACQGLHPVRLKVRQHPAHAGLRRSRRQAF